jgi:predicted aspartyl protease
MPQVAVKINDVQLKFLCDTGAAHGMIRKSMTTLLGLKIQACEGEEHPNFIMADGRRRRPEGFVTTSGLIGGVKVLMEL